MLSAGHNSCLLLVCLSSHIYSQWKWEQLERQGEGNEPGRHWLHSHYRTQHFTAPSADGEGQADTARAYWGAGMTLRKLKQSNYFNHYSRLNLLQLSPSFQSFPSSLLPFMSIGKRKSYFWCRGEEISNASTKQNLLNSKLRRLTTPFCSFEWDRKRNNAWKMEQGIRIYIHKARAKEQPPDNGSPARFIAVPYFRREALLTSLLKSQHFLIHSIAIPSPWAGKQTWMQLGVKLREASPMLQMQTGTGKFSALSLH